MTREYEYVKDRLAVIASDMLMHNDAYTHYIAANGVRCITDPVETLDYEEELQDCFCCPSPRIWAWEQYVTPSTDEEAIHAYRFLIDDGSMSDFKEFGDLSSEQQIKVLFEASGYVRYCANAAALAYHRLAEM